MWSKIRTGWSGVAVDHVESLDGDQVEVGAKIHVSALVRLGDLAPDDVEVQAIAGRVDPEDHLTDVTPVALKPASGPDPEGRLLYEGPLALDRTGPFGYTVRILPAHHLLSDGAEMGLVAVPSEGTGEGAYEAPFPLSTAGIVFSRIFKSSMGDQESMYSRSSCIQRSKSRLLRPLTCQRPVMPGLTRWRAK